MMDMFHLSPLLAIKMNKIALVNNFATRCFRDTADKDYVHARMAYRTDLMPQFFWSSLHCLEKYFKCVLLLARINGRKISHEITPAIDRINEKFEIHFTDQTNQFFKRLEHGARFRYLEVSWHSVGNELSPLDRAVWELRRYCNISLYNYTSNKVAVNKEKLKKIQSIDLPTKENTLIPGGWLEKVVEGSKNTTRDALIWKNLFYSKSNRKRILMPAYLKAENSPLSLHPEILDDVLNYVFLPKEIIEAYRNHKKG